jgi:hypothetical protein
MFLLKLIKQFFIYLICFFSKEKQGFISIFDKGYAEIELGLIKPLKIEVKILNDDIEDVYDYFLSNHYGYYYLDIVWKVKTTKIIFYKISYK